MAEWPHTVSLFTAKPSEIMEVLANRVPESPVGIEWDEDVAIAEPVYYPSKSPMKYAVDYKLVDSDGLIIEDTDYFITAEEAWDRLMELNDLSGLEGMITIRSL
jgi:hypothetical protein